MPMHPTDLKIQTKGFAPDVIRFLAALPKDEASRIPGRHRLRSETPAGASYRSAKCPPSTAGFTSRTGVVEWLADEFGYWIELLIESGKVAAGKSAALLKAASGLGAITVTPIETVRGGAGVRHGESRTRNVEMAGTKAPARKERSPLRTISKRRRQPENLRRSSRAPQSARYVRHSAFP